VECLPRNHEALSLSPSATKIQKRINENKYIEAQIYFCTHTHTYIITLSYGINLILIE
jgi:hypothetical protein